MILYTLNEVTKYKKNHNHTLARFLRSGFVQAFSAFSSWSIRSSISSSLEGLLSNVTVMQLTRRYKRSILHVVSK